MEAGDQGRGGKRISHALLLIFESHVARRSTASAPRANRLGRCDLRLLLLAKRVPSRLDRLFNSCCPGEADCVPPRDRRSMLLLPDQWRCRERCRTSRAVRGGGGGNGSTPGGCRAIGGDRVARSSTHVNGRGNHGSAGGFEVRGGRVGRSLAPSRGAKRRAPKFNPVLMNYHYICFAISRLLSKSIRRSLAVVIILTFPLLAPDSHTHVQHFRALRRFQSSAQLAICKSNGRFSTAPLASSSARAACFRVLVYLLAIPKSTSFFPPA